MANPKVALDSKATTALTSIHWRPLPYLPHNRFSGYRTKTDPCPYEYCCVCRICFVRDGQSQGSLGVYTSTNPLAARSCPTPHTISVPRSSDQVCPQPLCLLLRFFATGFTEKAYPKVALDSKTAIVVLTKSPNQWAMCALTGRVAGQIRGYYHLYSRSIVLWLVCFWKSRWLGRLSARFGNYLLQQNKIKWNLLIINQDQQLFLFKITNPRRQKTLTFAFVGGLMGYVSRDRYIDGWRHSELVHSYFQCNKITE